MKFVNNVVTLIRYLNYAKFVAALCQLKQKLKMKAVQKVNGNINGKLYRNITPRANRNRK